jgi:hypothetical protein
MSSSPLFVGLSINGISMTDGVFFSVETSEKEMEGKGSPKTILLCLIVFTDYLHLRIFKVYR